MLTEDQRTEIQREVEARVRALLLSPSTVREGQALEPLVRVIARAVEVLGASDKALRWLNTPVRSLGDQAPVSLLNSPEGITRVEDVLGRIEHGVW
jgi:putative toxin-antitoxin system antitoxin component (TIGR02293 family)